MTKVNLNRVETTLRSELYELEVMFTNITDRFKGLECIVRTGADRISAFLRDNCGHGGSLFHVIAEIGGRFNICLCCSPQKEAVKTFDHGISIIVYDNQSKFTIPLASSGIDIGSCTLCGIAKAILVYCLDNEDVYKQSAEEIAEELRHMSIALKEDCKEIYDTPRIALFSGNKFSIIEMIEYWSMYPNGSSIFTIYEDETRRTELVSINLIKLDREAKKRDLINNTIKVYPNAIGVLVYDSRKHAILKAADMGLNVTDELTLEDIIFSLLQSIMSQPRADLELIDNLKKQLECLDYTMSKLDTTHPTLPVFKEAWYASQQVLKEVTSVKNDTLTIQKESKENSTQIPGNMDLFRE